MNTSLFHRSLLAGLIPCTSLMVSAQDLVYADPLQLGNPGAIVDITHDDAGNTYICGYLSDTVDLDPSAAEATFNYDPDYGRDGFLAKYGPNGAYLWGTVLPSSRTADAVAINHAGEVVLLFERSGYAVYFYSQDGTELGGISMSGTYDGGPLSMAITSNDDMVITGSGPQYLDLDPGPGLSLAQPGNNGLHSPFIQRWTHSGTQVYHRRLTGPGSGTISDVAVDGTGDIVVVGTIDFSDLDLDPTGSDAPVSNVGNTNPMFLAKYDADGGLLWGFNSGDSSYMMLPVRPEMVLGADNSIYITGAFGYMDLDPGPGVDPLTSNAGDGFLLRYLSDGSLAWGLNVTMGLGSNSEGYALDIDANGHVLVLGRWNSVAHFNPTAPDLVWYAGASSGQYITMYDSGTGAFQGLATWSGALFIHPFALNVHPNGDIVLSGQFGPTNFDLDPGAGDYTLTCTDTVDVTEYFLRMGPLSVSVGTNDRAADVPPLLARYAADALSVTTPCAVVGADLRVIDGAGRVILRERMDGTSATVPLRLAAGVYTVSLGAGDRISSQRIAVGW